MGDECGILAMHAHARVERAQAPQRQIAIEWRTGDAGTVRPPHEPLVQLWSGCDNRTADDIAVTVEVFRSRVQYQIGSERDRSLPHRRQECIVDEYQGTRGMRLL